MHQIPLKRGVRFLSELVSKIETSQTKLKKRCNNCSKKIKKFVKEQVRIARKDGLYAIAMTLTYKNDNDFVGKNISKFIDVLKKKYQRKGVKIAYVWTLEKATCLHYHLIIWLPKKMAICHKDLQNWWPWGSTWLEACRKVSAWAKYISKRCDKYSIPSSARMFGYGGLDVQGRLAMKKISIPLWLNKIIKGVENIKRIPKVGWVDISNGVIYPSPWKWTPYGIKLVIS